MSLTPKQTNILRLIQRSKPYDGGWYRVSKVVWPLVSGILPEDLLETKAAEEGSEAGGFIRFTERGHAVLIAPRHT
jgi:hypothetical protein